MDVRSLQPWPGDQRRQRVRCRDAAGMSLVPPSFSARAFSPLVSDLRPVLSLSFPRLWGLGAAPRGVVCTLGWGNGTGWIDCW